MAAIRSRDTQPEMAIRRGLHARGFRYSLHSSDLPGKPDVVLPKYRAIIWIHGCYWHGHDCGEVKPASTNKAYWGPKIEKNRARDARNRASMDAASWRHLTVWECAFRRKGPVALEEVLTSLEQWLRQGSPSAEIRLGSHGLELKLV
jgi:DNA mismatch endonuclease (patch repair protein)